MHDNLSRLGAREFARHIDELYSKGRIETFSDGLGRGTGRRLVLPSLGCGCGDDAQRRRTAMGAAAANVLGARVSRPTSSPAVAR
jgi:hypothetical protein